MRPALILCVCDYICVGSLNTVAAAVSITLLNLECTHNNEPPQVVMTAVCYERQLVFSLSHTHTCKVLFCGKWTRLDGSSV